MSVVTLLISCKDKKSNNEANIASQNKQEVKIDTMSVTDYEMIFHNPADNNDSIVYLYTGTVKKNADNIVEPYGKGHAVVKVGRYKNSVYDGTFFQGLFDGDNCKIVFANGESFEGKFNVGFYSEGTYTESDGGYLVGIFSDDEPFDVDVFDSNGNNLGNAYKVAE